MKNSTFLADEFSIPKSDKNSDIFRSYIQFRLGPPNSTSQIPIHRKLSQLTKLSENPNLKM